MNADANFTKKSILSPFFSIGVIREREWLAIHVAAASDRMWAAALRLPAILYLCERENAALGLSPSRRRL
jgi:hypothetical protein